MRLIRQSQIFFIPQAGRFPMIILWAVVAIAVVWFIWNKTTFGKIYMQLVEIQRRQLYQESRYLK